MGHAVELLHTLALVTTAPAVRVVLASASPARRRVLRAAGVEPVVHVSDVDEDAVLAGLPPGTTPADTVRALAAAKARAVAAAHADELGDTDTLVIGCDSMLLFDGALSGKPHEPAVAATQWREMRGRNAELLTGHHVMRLRPDAETVEVGDTSSTTIVFADADDATIDTYVATGEPLEVAGAFTLDGYGGWLVERIDGDPSSVIGIGLPLVRKLIGQTGVALSDVWQPIEATPARTSNG